MNYWKKSIKKLTDKEAVQKRYWMYIGSNDIKWYLQLFYEIFSNSIDEAINWYWDTIYVRLIDKNTIEIEDNWRWIPFWVNNEWEEVLNTIFTELHAGWKMDNTDEASWYKFSWWTNGVWTSVVNYMSSFLEVESRREWKIANLSYIDGESKKWTVIKKDSKWKNQTTWTRVRFSPNLSLFEKSVKWFPIDSIKKIIKDQIYIQEMKVVFEDNISDETHTYINNEWFSKYINDYNERVEDNWDNENKENNAEETSKKRKLVTPMSGIFTNKDLICEWQDNKKILLDYWFEFIKEDIGNIKWYTNSISNNDGWTHVNGFQLWIYEWFKKALIKSWKSDNNFLKDLKPKDVYDSIVWIVSVKLSDPAFYWQTKSKLTTTYVKNLVKDKIIIDFQKQLTEDDIVSIKKWLQQKIDKRNALEKESKKLEKIDNEKTLEKRLKTKMRDASTKDRMKAEMYIVEWDSAGWTLKSTRNVEFQAVMPLKWKPINVFNNTPTKIFTNTEINNMIYAISGWYVNWDFIKEKHLRYWKIIIAADADNDWYHIVLLTLSFLLKFYPELIEDWHVYINITPLFKCKYKSDIRYFYTQKSLNEFVSTKEWSKYSVDRFKWLWEFKPEDWYKLIMSSKTRKLQKVVTSNIDDSVKWFSDLMWSDSQFKFDLFNEYIHEMLERMDNDTLWLDDKIKDVIDIWKNNSTIYSLEVNKDRGIPNFEDWLKVWWRRILYTLKNDLKNVPEKFIKSATVVGWVMWSYHPHGDSSIYKAAIWLLRDFSNRLPLIDGQWNWWSPDWDNAAAHRYTEMSISKLSNELYMDDLYKNPVDYVPNFDNTKKEPSVLPAKIPFVLLNDNFGIGYWKMRNSMIPHNIREVLNAVLAYINKKKNEKFNAMDYIKGPDVVAWNYIYNTTQEIRDIYNNPKWGMFRFRVPVNIIKEKGQKKLEFTEYPYRVYNFEDEYRKIIEKVEDKKILWVKSVEDRSGVDKTNNKKWFRFIFNIDQKIDINLIIEDIYKETIFEKTEPYVPLFLNKEKELNYYTLNEIISNFVEFRKETIIRIKKYEIEQIEKELKNLFSKWLHALNIDEIVKIIKKWKDRKSIKSEIIKKYNNKVVLWRKLILDDEMAETIITTQLININDIKSIEDKIKKKEKEISSLKAIIEKPLVLKKYMLKEYIEILNQYKNVNRKTKIISNKDYNILKGHRENLQKHIKEMKEQEKVYLNLLYVDNNDIIVKFPLATEDKLKAKQEELIKWWNITFSEINDNTWKLFILTDTNQWFNIKLENIKDKVDNTANLIGIKWFKWNPISYIYQTINDNDKSNEQLYTIIYMDSKNKLWAYNIKKSDLLKNRQWYALWKNKVLYVGEYKKSLNVKDITRVKMSNWTMKLKTNLNCEKIPTKKTLSSWKLI